MGTSDVLASSFFYKESVVERKEVQSAANQKAWVNGRMLDNFGALLIPSYHIFLSHTVFLITEFSVFGAFGWCGGNERSC